jgi:PAS domain S-box-containing protein
MAVSSVPAYERSVTTTNPADHDEEGRFRRLVDTLDHAVVWEFDETLGAYTFVSQHSQLVLGYACEEWMRDPHFFEQRVHPEDWPKLVQLFAKLRRGETADLRCEHRCRREDGTTIWVHTGVHFDEHLGHALFRGVTIDVNHLKVAEEQQRLAREQAERAAKARDEILAVVAHDLRNPLHTIRMACSVLEQASGPANHSAVILRAVDRMQHLIDDLVDAASIRASRLKITASECDAASLLRQLADDFAADAQHKQVTLRREINSTAELRCDGRRIHQALSNLLHNALKFTPEGGTVTLRLAIDPLHAALSVEDTGRGIAEHELDKVFEREWQSDDTAHLGSGMGLYIAKGIVEAHGGTIQVSSQLGQGSIFTVLLPMP